MQIRPPLGHHVHDQHADTFVQVAGDLHAERRPHFIAVLVPGADEFDRGDELPAASCALTVNVYEVDGLSPPTTPEVPVVLIATLPPR